MDANVKIQKLLVGSEGLTRPVSKLVDATSGFLGRVSEPILIYLNEYARSRARVANAQADVDIQSIEHRAQLRVGQAELSKQRNIDAVVKGAVDLMPQSVSDDAVDQDWITKFFSYAQDVGREDVQVLWSKLLAGEVAAPGTFSLRTLHSVSLMRLREAHLFTRFCSFVWTDDGGPPVAILRDHDMREIVSRVLSWPDLVVLEAAGLIHHTPLGSHILTESESTSLDYFDRRFLFKHSARKKIDIGCYALTDVGQELAPLAGASVHAEYLAMCQALWASEGIEVSDLGGVVDGNT